ncbi:hypothetical protein ABT104_12780 [Streptomyces mobaraensis]|uniref:hypothetical protein n=1 Tax=Streptomyces mobaraensis TaxID=35621 RepID=UPI00332E59FF
MRRLISTLALSGTLLVAGALPAAAAHAPSGDSATAVTSTGQAQLMTSAHTTLWLGDAHAKVWKTWTKARGGGYNGKFGVTEATRYYGVYVMIDWNSGKHTMKKLQVGKTYTYKGAKRVLMDFCADYKCSAWW